MSLFATLTWDDIQLGEQLGRGAFNQVNEAFLKPKQGLPSALYTNDVQSYALKFISDNRKSHEENLKISLTDLQSEANLLSELSHVNIIKLYAVHEDMGLVDVAFLLLDRLFDTVEDKLKSWSIQLLNRSPASVFADTMSLRKQHLAQDERLALVAVPVASAMEYLHSQRIVVRDLKPANLGFSRDGTLKMFDLGLARKLPNDGRRLTGCTGTMRYMAPEVAESQHYGVSADTYSFGILLWELCTLKKPFDKLTPDEIMELLVKEKRPKLSRKDGSPKVQQLIMTCWDGHAENRPSFATIHEKLPCILNLPLLHVSKNIRGFTLRRRSKSSEG